MEYALEKQTHLRRVRLNSGGYTPRGEYFGKGIPLWEHECEQTGASGYVRAYTRSEAKELVRKFVASQVLRYQGPEYVVQFFR